MRCEDFQANVVAWHFGEVTAEEREAAEQHLVGCAACLREYLKVKRELEAPAEAPRPSAASREKLRGAVADLVAPKPARWLWWERPLAFALAGAAALLAISLVGSVGTSDGRAPVSMTAGAHGP